MTRIHLSAAVGAVAWFVGLHGINEQRLAAATAEETVTLSEEPSTAATSSTDSAADAPQLVKDALAAALDGKTEEREALLARAIAADPDYAPARWRLGEVRFEGKWRTLEEIHDRVDANPRRDEYLEQKASLPDEPAAHAELARWCMRNGLENEERYHWTKVLFAEPGHELAKSRLNLRSYRGRLFTQQEIADIESSRAEASVNLNKYKPVFTELCRRVTTTKSSERESALTSIRRIDDPAQLPALEQAIQRAAHDASPADSLDLYLALIQALSNVPDYEATSALLNYSLFAVVPEVRHAAARSLKGRPVTDYVPRLMSLLTSPIEGDIATYVAPDGTVSYAETLYQAGPLADQRVNRGRDYVLFATASREPTQDEVNRAVGDSQMEAVRMAQRARRRIAFANAQAAAGNARVREVLAGALDFDLGDDPKQYWQAWTEYNELAFEEHPVYEFNQYDRQYEPATHSCFMAGTPVWTQQGMRPIETIVVGDMVLAQHPVTGEVAYRAVLEKTLGPPTPTVAIALPQETIVATRGHRFWVERQGWEMAKSLKPEMTLHSITSSLPVASVEPYEDLECHNMVVEGFHTYFIGKSQILVHDKTCPRPTISKTPGQEAAASAAKQRSNLHANAREPLSF
jgi:hypothetical protein